MNNNIVRSAILATVLFSSSLTMAGGYAGGNVMRIDYSEDLDDYGWDDADADLTAIYGRIGGSFNDYISAEFRLGLGLGEDNVSVSGLSIDLSLDYLVGGYFRLGVPLGEVVYPYIIAGFTQAELTAEAAGYGGSVSYSDSDSDASYGIGVDFNAGEVVTINLEYMRYFDKGAIEVNGISIGVVGRF